MLDAKDIEHGNLIFAQTSALHLLFGNVLLFGSVKGVSGSQNAFDKIIQPIDPDFPVLKASADVRGINGTVETRVRHRASNKIPVLIRTWGWNGSH